MRTTIALGVFLAVAFAGCGGGGSGSSSLPAGGSSSTATAPLSTQEVAEAGSEAALSPLETSDSETMTIGGINGPQSSRRSTLSTGTCTNRHIVIKTQLAPNQVQIEHKYFFDAACTQLARDVVATVTTNSPSSSSIDRTATNYNLAAQVLSTRKGHFDITGSAGNFSAVHTSQLFVGTSTTPAAQFGRQVTVAPQSANVETFAANSGHVVNVVVPKIDESFGHTGVVANGTETTDANGNVTFAGTHTSTLFKGPLGALVLAAAPPFTVTGGSQIGTVTLSGNVTYDANGMLTNVALTGTLLNGNALTVTSAGSPLVVSGTITSPAGANVATFTTDAFGDGTITFADGSQAQIFDWHVVK